MMKQPSVTYATASRLCFAAVAVFLVASTTALPQAQDAGTYRLPLFRHVETGAKAPQIAPTETVRLLADTDFPPSHDFITSLTVYDLFLLVYRTFLFQFF